MCGVFSPPKRKIICTANSSPVKLKKLHIDTKPNAEDFIMNSFVATEPLPPHIPFAKEDTPDTMTLGMLKIICPGQPITMKAKVKHLNEPRRHKVNLPIAEDPIEKQKLRTSVVWVDRWVDDATSGYLGTSLKLQVVSLQEVTQHHEA